MKSGLVRYGPNSAEVGSPHGTGFRIIALLTNINIHDSFPLLQPTQKNLPAQVSLGGAIFGRQHEILR